MDRRLYFLFPSEHHVRLAIDELNDAGIEDAHLHVISHYDLTRENIPPLQQLYRMDRSWRVERFAWTANLVIFFIAAVGFVLSLMWWLYVWSVVTVLIMLATMMSGFWFALKVPNVHLDEFHDALMRNEILLSVVVHKNRVAEIENLVHRRHPEAYGGGMGWSVEALGV